VAVYENGTLLGVASVTSEQNGGKVKVGFVGLLSKLTELNGGTKLGQGLGKELAHANNIRTSLGVGGDGGDLDGLIETCRMLGTLDKGWSYGRSMNWGAISSTLRSQQGLQSSLHSDTYLAKKPSS
jgi:hypothetical protein